MKSQNPYSEFQGPAGPGLLACRLLSAFISYHFSTCSFWLSDWACTLFTRNTLVFPFPDYRKHASLPGHLHILCSLAPHSYIIWSYASFKSTQMSPAQRGLFSTIPHNTIAAPSWHSLPPYLATFVHAKLLQLCPSLQSYGPYGPWGSCPWDSPVKNTRVGCHILLQGIFPTQGSNPCLSLISPALAGRFFITSTTWEALTWLYLF